MKKLQILVLMLVSLTLAMPATFSFATTDKSSEASQVLTKKINVNSASEAELTEVPGIGPVTAKKIRAYTQENGDFKKIDDLTNVKGIGQKTLEKMKPYITI